MDELDRYEAKVLMHRIKYRKRSETIHACAKCGTKTNNADSMCTFCLVNNLGEYVGIDIAIRFNNAVIELENIESELNMVLSDA